MNEDQRDRCNKKPVSDDRPFTRHFKQARYLQVAEHALKVFPHWFRAPGLLAVLTHLSYATRHCVRQLPLADELNAKTVALQLSASAAANIITFRFIFSPPVLISGQARPCRT
jgi:hypothetical protein